MIILRTIKHIDAMEAAKNAITKRYSEALFNAAKDANALDKIADDLKKLQNVFEENKNYLRMIFPKVVPSNIKSVFLNTAVSKLELEDIMNNFLKVLVKYNRLYLLNDIIKKYFETLKDYKGELVVVVTTAIELDEKKKAALLKELKEIFNKQITLDVVVDKQVLGGLSVRVKSFLMDATLKNKLLKIKRLALQN